MTSNIWNVDNAHSGIHFSVRHMVVTKVRGRFTNWKANLDLGSREDLSDARVDVTIEAASIETGVADRDNHLRSADFLNAEAFPELRFQSKRITSTGKNALRVVGDLTIAGVTREIPLEVSYGGRAKDPWGNERVLFSAETTINREDFGLKWNQLLEAGGVLVGEKVEIEIELQAVKASAQAA
ncbi:MAG: YceI family protein [Myxococcota bacterium]|nr:YceI family protein [Myxococcota bacterium]